MTSRSLRTFASAVATLLLAAGSARAGAHDFVVYLPGMGGTTQTAQPYIDNFLRTIEKSQGWGASSAIGSYFDDAKQAQDFIASKQPGFGMIAPSMLLDLTCKKQVEPMLSVVGSFSVASSKFHVVVKDPALKDLASLQGKKIISNHLQDPKYVSRVIFENKIDVEKHFAQHTYSPSPLKPFKSLDRDEVDAALINDAQLEAIKKQPLGAKLKVIYTSPGLPFALVAFGKTATAADQASVKKALIALCGSNPDVCKQLQITKFEALSGNPYAAAQQQYCK